MVQRSDLLDSPRPHFYHVCCSDRASVVGWTMEDFQREPWYALSAVTFFSVCDTCLCSKKRTEMHESTSFLPPLHPSIPPSLPPSPLPPSLPPSLPPPLLSPLQSMAYHGGLWGCFCYGMYRRRGFLILERL